MIEKFHFMSYYFTILGLITQIALFALQLKTYRKTGQRSLLFMAGGAVIGVLYLLTVESPIVFGLSLEARWSLTLLGGTLVTIQAIVGVGSVAFMFRAFEVAVAAQRVSLGGTPKL